MRIAVVGLGFMGSTHLKAWKNVPGAQLVAVCSEDPKKLEGDLSTIQGNLGGPGERYDFSGIGRYSRIEHVLKDTDVDAVDICLPTHLHSDTAIAALQAGKHVLVEKPMALTGAIANQIIAEAKKHDKIVMAAQVLRFVPAYRALADALSSGDFGKTRSALLRRRCAAPSWSKWLADESKSGGGVFDLLIHDVDFCVKLFGLPEAVSATGYEDLAGGIDNITAALHYNDVPSVVITGGWHHKTSYPFSMEYTFITDSATFEYNSARGDGVTLFSSEGEERPLSIPSEDPFEAELRYFAECVNSNSAPGLCPPEQSAAAVEVTRLLVKAREKNGEKIKWEL